MAEQSRQPEQTDVSRRGFLASLLMGIGLLLSYGMLAVDGLLFILPRRTRPRTRKIYAGNLAQYTEGTLKSFYDLEGKEILVKRFGEELKAFSSVCPHLGCRVHWEADNHRFFCPCHGGVFDEDGQPVAGPPADANTPLFAVPVTVDHKSGIVYIEVTDSSRRRG
ncbi:MAG TPA: Rieske (2Fe-2S) protein [Bacteroidetes bacterium]|nr:Rieske (2Fe-2S) protein [Bacteroidota bacterium]